MEVSRFGVVTVVDLIPDGKNILVTEENKKDYLKRLCYFKMGESISEQTRALLEGLREIIPIDALKLLDEKELGLLISGMPNIDRKKIISSSDFLLK